MDILLADDLVLRGISLHAETPSFESFCAALFLEEDEKPIFYPAPEEPAPCLPAGFCSDILDEIEEDGGLLFIFMEKQEDFDLPGGFSFFIAGDEEFENIGFAFDD